MEARNYGYARKNEPKAWCLHTPEEPADSNPITPYYFHNTTRQASTHYFVSYLGLVFQCVPENSGAYANGVEGKPYPAWADPDVNLNLQTLSIEIEGYASSIHQTMVRGGPQWKALTELMAHRCSALGIDPELTFGHKEVSIYRVDPGALDIRAVIDDVKAIMEGDGGDDLSLTEDQSNKLNTTWIKVEELWNLLKVGEVTQGPGWTSGGLRQLVKEEVDRAIAALQAGDGSHKHD